MTTEEKFEFINRVSFEGLFQKIREVTGMDDLKFQYELKNNYNGEPYPQYCSQDLVDRVGFLNLMFKHVYIKQFNSSVGCHDGEPFYWGTVAFSYEHHPCGSNGSDFMTVWYDDMSGWTFRLEKDKC